MKTTPFFISLFCALSLVCVGGTSAEKLNDDYVKLEIKRQQLEKLRRDYEARLEELTAGVNIAVADLNSCIDVKSDRNLKKNIWENKLKEVGAARKAKEKERSELNDLKKALNVTRLRLEGMRAAIEEKYRNKRRGDDYEAEFRNYMERLEKEYLNVIETKLFNGYRDYIKWAERYLAFLDGSLELCQKNDPSLFFSEAEANALQNDYQHLVNRRRELEKARIAYERKLEALASRVREGVSDLNRCVRRMPVDTLKRSVWEHRLNEIEAARAQKEKNRKDLISLKTELENVRRNIEAHRREIEKKHADNRDDDAYKTEIRNYMEQMENKYLNRIKTELFPGYADYLVWVEEYIAFLDDSLALCEQAG